MNKNMDIYAELDNFVEENEVGLDTPLCNATEEAYAYLIGWIGDCIEDFLSETTDKEN